MGVYPSARAFDRLYLDKQITESQFEEACRYYRTADDPAVKSCQQRNFIKIMKAKKSKQ